MATRVAGPPSASPGHLTWTFNELEALWIKAGGSPKAAPIAAAIAMAESGGHVYAHNPSGASGLWQILGQVSPGNIYDPEVNAKNAVSKWRSAKGFSPWVAYTSGSFRSFLEHHAGPNWKQIEKEAEGTWLTQIGEGVEGVVKPADMAAKAFVSLVEALGSAQFWIRAGEAVGGVILLYIALKGLTGTGASDLPGASSAARHFNPRGLTKSYGQS